MYFFKIICLFCVYTALVVNGVGAETVTPYQGIEEVIEEILGRRIKDLKNEYYADENYYDYDDLEYPNVTRENNQTLAFNVTEGNHYIDGVRLDNMTDIRSPWAVPNGSVEYSMEWNKDLITRIMTQNLFDGMNKTSHRLIGPSGRHKILVANTNFTGTENTNSSSSSVLTSNTRTTPILPVGSRLPRQLNDVNISAFLNILSNLTHEYDTNITRELNETIMRMYTVPACNHSTTLEPITAEPEGINFTGTIISKCFVCGLDEGEIPRSAHCADAFSGDFLPLVPVDHKARGSIASYRKYCRYSNLDNFMFSEQDRRSIFGRWTGGCSVRWVDLSGVYTQRSCRNKQRASLGHHYVSKRMAKLEMALQHEENGCIVSPMATLVPFSRGVSLYARFHACVCTGNWCNAAPLHQPWIATFAAQLTLLFGLS